MLEKFLEEEIPSKEFVYVHKVDFTHRGTPSFEEKCGVDVFHQELVREGFKDENGNNLGNYEVSYDLSHIDNGEGYVVWKARINLLN